MTRKQKNVLVSVYNALCGIESEMGAEFFNQYYTPGDGEKMMQEFEAVLKQVSPESFANHTK